MSYAKSISYCVALSAKWRLAIDRQAPCAVGRNARNRLMPVIALDDMGEIRIICAVYVIEGSSGRVCFALPVSVVRFIGQPTGQSPEALIGGGFTGLSTALLRHRCAGFRGAWWTWVPY